MPGCLIQTTLSNTPQCFRQGFETWSQGKSNGSDTHFIPQHRVVLEETKLSHSGHILRNPKVDPYTTIKITFNVILTLRANISSGLSRNGSDDNIPKLLPQFLRIPKTAILGIAASQPITSCIIQSGTCS